MIAVEYRTVTAVCRIEGCPHRDIAIDAEVPADAFPYVICGACGNTITDVADAGLMKGDTMTETPKDPAVEVETTVDADSMSNRVRIPDNDDVTPGNDPQPESSDGRQDDGRDVDTGRDVEVDTSDDVDNGGEKDDG